MSALSGDEIRRAFDALSQAQRQPEFGLNHKAVLAHLLPNVAPEQFDFMDDLSPECQWLFVSDLLLGAE